jgi:hypothetical protein
MQMQECWEWLDGQATLQIHSKQIIQILSAVYGVNLTVDMVFLVVVHKQLEWKVPVYILME